MDPVATVPLALWDFVPVLLAGIGCLLLAQVSPARVRSAAVVGASLVLVGGLSKAAWKLVLAATGHDLGFFEVALFVLLAPGFALLAWALLAALDRSVTIAVPLAVVVAGFIGAVLTRSTGPLLAVAVLGATATGVLALLLARRRGDQVAMLLFALQLTLAFALVPLARPPHSVGKQWLEELLNAVGEGALALGAARLRQRTSTPAAAAGALLLSGSSS